MRLSILICSIESRNMSLKRLYDSLYYQLTPENKHLVEILIEVDNKRITTGAKRNILLWKAKGDYICYIDDDDNVTDDYVELILNAIETNPDCVGTCGWYSVDGGAKTKWMLSKDYEDHDDGGILYRRTNHLSPVKRELALLALFPDKSNAEDKEYSQRLNPFLKTEVVIDKPIYHYDYSTMNKQYV